MVYLHETIFNATDGALYWILNTTFRCGNTLYVFESNSKTYKIVPQILNATLKIVSCNTPLRHNKTLKVVLDQRAGATILDGSLRSRRWSEFLARLFSRAP